MSGVPRTTNLFNTDIQSITLNTQKHKQFTMQDVIQEISLISHSPQNFEDIILNQDLEEKIQFFEAIQFNMNQKAL